MKVPLLVTMDLELAYDHDIVEQGLILDKICNDIEFLKLPMTVFVTSEFAGRYPKEARKLHIRGCEIGCHGLDHRRKENYKRMGKEQVYSFLSSASKGIESKLEVKPLCFRGPGMATSSITQNLLHENGYIADFSVCSQRLDFFNTMGGSIRWLTAPRNAYNPKFTNPYKKGKLPIWVIPLSGIGVPFMSGILYLFGLRFMKSIFYLLLNEAIKRGNPIVYLFHSYEFTHYTGNRIYNGKDLNEGRLKQPIIHRLYRTDIELRYRLNFELIKYMLSFCDVRPFTGKDYCEQLDDRSK